MCITNLTMGLHWSCETETTRCLHDMGELNNHDTTTKETKSPGQTSNHINNHNNKKHPPSKCGNHDRPNANWADDTKTGISAYIRLKDQLPVPFDTKGKGTPNLQYWENPINEYNIKTPITDTCNARVWEKTYNVNLESLKGGKKHLRHSEYTIHTDGSKKQEGTGGVFVIYNYNNRYTHRASKCKTTQQYTRLN